MTNNNLPRVKPGSQSTEFKGKVIAQFILGVLEIINVILSMRGMDAIVLEPGTPTAIGVGLEALWGLYRQMVKGAEIKAQGSVEAARQQQWVEVSEEDLEGTPFTKEIE